MTKNKFMIFAISMLALLCSCGHEVATYTSQDLALLPCETNSRLFFPIEFDKNGTRIYESQWNELEKEITRRTVRDVFVFVHGWDKTASLAEKDYQDFVCRFYARVDIGTKGRLSASSEEQSSVFVGLFWPSTIFANHSDMAIIKPATYYAIRSRADVLASSGFQEIMRLFEEMLVKHNQTLRGVRFHFIGHSFGGRVIAKGFLDYFKTVTTQVNPSWLFLEEKVNLILLLPALSQDALGVPDQLFKVHAAADTKTDRKQDINQMSMKTENVPAPPRTTKSETRIIPSSHDRPHRPEEEKKETMQIDKDMKADEATVTKSVPEQKPVEGENPSARRGIPTDISGAVKFLKDNDALIKQIMESTEETTSEIEKLSKQLEDAKKDSQSLLDTLGSVENELQRTKSLTDYTRMSSKIHIAIIYSYNDFANRFLFPIGTLLSPLSSDKIGCALGGCGVPNVKSMMTDQAGNILDSYIMNNEKVVNINASGIIFSHTDIYKGRVANLLWQVIENADKAAEAADRQKRAAILDAAAKISRIAIGIAEKLGR
jgi:hypothetical protein